MTAQNYALVDGAGNVSAVVLWDGANPPAFPGFTPVLAPAGVGPGYTYSGGVFTPGQTPAQQAAANYGILTSNLAAALARCDQIQAQAAAFVAQAPYGTANLANLNDLLSKSQTIAQAVSDLAGYVVAIGRIMTGQLGGTS